MIPAQFKKSLTLALTVGGNMVPFYGIVFWGWDIFSIFFLYWAENAVIGVYTLMMMGFHEARRGVLAFIGALFMMTFFVFHYGMFCMAHLAILTELFGPDIGHKNFQPEDIVPLLLSPKVQGFYWAMAGLALAQAFQCVQSYITTYSKAKMPQEIMFSPYGRIIVLHIAILVGGLMAKSMGQPIAALAVLVAMKTLYDIIAVNMNKPDLSNAQVQT